MGRRFMVDLAGSLVDIETGKIYDYFEEVVDLLNDIVDENKTYKEIFKILRGN